MPKARQGKAMCNVSYLCQFISTKTCNLKDVFVLGPLFRSTLVMKWLLTYKLNTGSVITCRFTSSNYIINQNITQNIQMVKKKLNLEHQLVLLVEAFLVDNSKNKVFRTGRFCKGIIQNKFKRKHFPEKSKELFPEKSENTEKIFKNWNSREIQKIISRGI